MHAEAMLESIDILSLPLDRRAGLTWGIRGIEGMVCVRENLALSPDVSRKLNPGRKYIIMPLPCDADPALLHARHHK